MIYAKKMDTTNSRFGGRSVQVITTQSSVGPETKIPIPDRLVICNGCNRNIFPEPGYLVYLGKRELNTDQPYDIYCGGCLTRYFPKAQILEN